MNDLLGKDKIMENNNEPKSAIRIILGFFDYYEIKVISRKRLLRKD